MKKIDLRIALFILIAIITGNVRAQFTQGNIVVLQTKGTANKAASQATLKEYTISGAPGTTIIIDSTIGATSPFITGGQFGGSEGFITTSSDNKFIVLGGYAFSNAADVTATTSSTVNRVVGKVSAAGIYTQLFSSDSFYTENDIRGAVSDGTNFWASGASKNYIDGIDYFGPGTQAGLATGGTPPKAYGMRIFNNQIYYSTQKSGPNNSSSQLGIFKLGTIGLPTSGTQTVSSVIINVTSPSGNGNATPTDFSFSNDGKTCYIAINTNSSIGGIQKWTNTTAWATSGWTYKYTLGTGVANIGAYGLIGDYSGSAPVLYATTFEAQTTGNRVIKIIDNGSIASSTITTIVASVAGTTNKGITFAPVCTLPSQPAAFTTKTTFVYKNQNAVAYSVPNVAGVTYNWSYSGTGATINGSGNSITVDYAATATSGNLSVTANNSCGSSIARTLAIAVNDPIVVPTTNYDYSFVTVGCNRVDYLDTTFTTGDPDYNCGPSTANVYQLKRLFTEIQHLNPLPKYLFMTGDIVMGYINDTVALAKQLTAWRQIYESHPLSSTSIQLIAIPGNHETQDKNAGKKSFVAAERTFVRIMAPYIKGSNGPGVGGADGLITDQSKLTYSFDSNGDHFIIINTDPVGKDGITSYNWIKNDLQQAEANHARHIFAFGHKPAYSSPVTPQGGLDAPATLAQRDSLWKYLEKYNCEAMFSAHEHLWDSIHPHTGKTWQVINGDGGSRVEPAWVGPGKQYYGYTLVNLYTDKKVNVMGLGRNTSMGTTAGQAPYPINEDANPTTIRNNFDICLTPQQPAPFTVGSSTVSAGQNNVVYTVPNDASVTYSWSYSGTGATINGTGNSVAVNFASTATGGNLSVTANSFCGASIARTMAITITAPTSFGAGNLIVLQTSNTASKIVSPITLKEVTPTGEAGLTFTIPATGPTPFQTAGIFGGSEGFLTTSTDNKFLVLGGY